MHKQCCNIVYAHAYPNGYSVSSGSTSFVWRASDGVSNVSVLSWHGSNGLTDNGAGTFAGDVAVNGGDLTTNQTAFNLINTTATTLNIGGAATTISMGASTGTTTVNHNMTVTGNLTVNGTTTTLNTETILAEDPVIVLNSGQATPVNDIGLLFQRYSSPTSTNYNVTIMWDEATDRFIFGKTAETGADTDITPSEEWMTIEASGDVGIGTNDPNAKLDVKIGTGSAEFNKGIIIRAGDGTFTAGHGAMLQFENEDVIQAGIRSIREGSWASGLQFYTHTAASGNTFDVTFTEKMRISADGNVGIGTATPGALLEIGNRGNTTTQTATNMWISGRATGALGTFGTLRFQNSTDSGGDYAEIQGRRNVSNYGTELWFSTNPSGVSGSPQTRMVIAESGNVGIGETSPDEILHLSLIHI